MLAPALPPLGGPLLLPPVVLLLPGSVPPHPAVGELDGSAVREARRVGPLSISPHAKALLSAPNKQ